MNERNMPEPTPEEEQEIVTQWAQIEAERQRAARMIDYIKDNPRTHPQQQFMRTMEDIS